MEKSHDYIHYYRGYWSEGRKCRIQIYEGDGAYSRSYLRPPAGQREHQRDEHGRVPGNGGHRGTRSGYSPSVDRALP